MIAVTARQRRCGARKCNHNCSAQFHRVPKRLVTLLASINDKTVTKIVRRYRYANAIAGQHTDVVATHAAAQLRAHQCAALIDLYGVLSTTEGILNDAFHFK